MKITGGKVFDLDQGFVERDLCFDGPLLTLDSQDGQSYDGTGCYVIPGLTDVHFHGCRGADLSDGDAAGLQTMAEYELSRGVTQICPAGMTLLEEQLIKVCRTAAAHKREGRPGADLAGINLEGPFLSYAKKGAQNGEWLHAPDVAMLRRLEEASEGLVKLVSVAPEEPGALDFIREWRRRSTCRWPTPPPTMTPPWRRSGRVPGRSPTSLTPCPALPTAPPAWWARPWTAPGAGWS